MAAATVAIMSDDNGTPAQSENPETPENRKSLVAFLRSIRNLRRSGKRAAKAECDGHFAALEPKVEEHRGKDDKSAIRSAN